MPSGESRRRLIIGPYSLLKSVFWLPIGWFGYVNADVTRETTRDWWECVVVWFSASLLADEACVR